MGDPATFPSASVRANDALRRRIVIASLLTLVLVAVTAAIVASIVLGTPAPAVDRSGGQEQVGVARAAPGNLAMESAFASGEPIGGPDGASLAVIQRPLTAVAHDTPSSPQPPTPTPRIMSLPTVTAQMQPSGLAAVGTRSGERWRIHHFGPFSAFGANSAGATPISATPGPAALTATPSVAATTADTLEVGKRVVVTVPSARLRSAPSLDGLVVAGLPQGRALVVTGPPVAGSGYLWYPVEVRKEPGMVGYVAADLIAPKDS